MTRQKGRIITMSEVAPRDTPLIYIAGPSRGAIIGWRLTVAQFMQRRTQANVAFPKFFSDEEELNQKFRKKVAWAYHHFDHAIQDGVLFFWFPKQNARCQGNAGPLSDHPYAINAERALGLCLGAKRYRPRIKVVVGYEKDYGRKQSLLDLFEHWNVGIEPIEDDLKLCCEQAVKLINY